MNLTKLAERVEAADAGYQRVLLLQAWAATAPTMGEAYTRFVRMLDAEAYESAAMQLVPEDMRDEIEITTLYRVARVTINMNHGPDGSPFYGSNECNSIPLAICAAALRAKAGEG